MNSELNVSSLTWYDIIKCFGYMFNCTVKDQQFVTKVSFKDFKGQIQIFFLPVPFLLDVFILKYLFKESNRVLFCSLIDPYYRKK